MSEAILQAGKDKPAATPAVRADRQGTASDAERAQAAWRAFVKDLYADTALWLDSCVRCGWCAEACHFYVQTGNPKYTPVHKLELFARTYRREVGPFRWLYRLVSKEVTTQELEQWQELIYDSCTVCGRCSMICPMGIDIASLVSIARHGMASAGLVPQDLWAPDRTGAGRGQSRWARVPKCSRNAPSGWPTRTRSRSPWTRRRRTYWSPSPPSRS